MAKLLIKNRQLEQDRWTLVRDAEAGVPDGPVIVPLAYWKQQRDSRAGADFGVWLAPADDPAELADAIAEFERYGSTGLMVRDPVVAALPVGGSFSLGQHQQFVKVLPQLLPVRLVRRGELTEVVALPR